MSVSTIDCFLQGTRQVHGTFTGRHREIEGRSSGDEIAHGMITGGIGRHRTTAYANVPVTSMVPGGFAILRRLLMDTDRIRPDTVIDTGQSAATPDRCRSRPQP